MGYEIELSDKAQLDLNALPPWLQAVVEAHLWELAESPSALSRPVVSPPYPPGGMMSQFDHGPLDGVWHHFAVFFRFRQDETGLVVFAIGHTALRMGPPQSS
jgi:hypothetical protein